jgi:hypothetical protein
LFLWLRFDDFSQVDLRSPLVGDVWHIVAHPLAKLPQVKRSLSGIAWKDGFDDGIQASIPDSGHVRVRRFMADIGSIQHAYLSLRSSTLP